MLKTLDTGKFIDGTRLFFGNVTKKQAKGLEFLFDKSMNSLRLNSLEKLAYVFATVQWETAYTFQPITEYGSQAYLRSKRYYPYIGRGYVQLTWEENYRKFGKALGVNLIENPKLANDPDIAWAILEMGMTDGEYGSKDPDFTIYTLEDFFNKDGNDFYNARKIINPRDKSSYLPIADAAMKFYRALDASIVPMEDAT